MSGSLEEASSARRFATFPGGGASVPLPGTSLRQSETAFAGSAKRSSAKSASSSFASAPPSIARRASLSYFVPMNAPENFLWNAGFVSCTFVRARSIPESGAGIEEKR